MSGRTGPDSINGSVNAQPTLETERLLLRPLRTEDAPAIADLAGEEGDRGYHDLDPAPLFGGTSRTMDCRTG